MSPRSFLLFKITPNTGVSLFLSASSGKLKENRQAKSRKKTANVCTLRANHTLLTLTCNTVAHRNVRKLTLVKSLHMLKPIVIYAKCVTIPFWTDQLRTAMTASTVTVEYQGETALVTLDRPDKFNALNYEMFLDICRVQKQLKRQRHIRLVIVTGRGGNFSSGLDIKSVIKKPLQPIGLLAKWLPGNANLAQRVSIGWSRLPMPVIAVIEGYCYGGGMQIALGADFRIASPGAKLSVMEAKWGLVPDMAGLVSLRNIMPKDKALELTMTARVLDAAEAEALGLVTWVDEAPMARAQALADELLKRSPDALAAIKFSTHSSWSARIRSLLARESWYQLRLLLGANFRLAGAREQGKTDKPYRPRQRFW
jgi:enoyl-CoA hydratase/carnithine racemase